MQASTLLGLLILCCVAGSFGQELLRLTESGDVHVDGMALHAVRQARLNDWKAKMEARRPHLKPMNPADHFHHVLGDIHVMMNAGRTYRSKKADLDIFGEPRFHDSTLRPKHHIFNSDWDDSMQDVLVDGNSVLIRTSRPEAMLLIKLRLGHVFGTGLDWSHEGDEEHPGPRHFLITQAPEEIEPGLILLENVIEVEYGDLWEYARIHMSVQNYQWSRNGTITHRAAPTNFRVFRPNEEGFDMSGRGVLHQATIHKRWGLFGWLANRARDVVQAIASATKAVVQTVASVATAIVQAVQAVPIILTALIQMGSQTGGSSYSFNYNPERGQRIRAIPIYPSLLPLPATANQSVSATPSPSASPSPGNEGGLVDVEVIPTFTMTLVCEDCWGKASFRTDTIYEVSSSGVPVAKIKTTCNMEMKTVLVAEVRAGISVVVSVPIVGVDTENPLKAASVSGNSASFKFSAGLFLRGSVAVDFVGTITQSNHYEFEGFVEFMVRGARVSFDAGVVRKKSLSDTKVEAQLSFALSASLGAEVEMALFGISASGFIGLTCDWELEYNPECVRGIEGTKAEIGAGASVEALFPPIFAFILGRDQLAKDWTFFSYPFPALQGCFLDPTPKSDKPEPLAVAPCTASFNGHLYSLENIVRPFEDPYTITSASGLQYEFNLCQGITGSSCTGENVGMCVKNDDTAYLVGASTYAIHAESSTVLSLTYKNGDQCGDKARQGKLILECDYAEDALLLLSANEPRECEYEIRGKTKYACPGVCKITVGTTTFDFLPLVKPAGESYSFTQGAVEYNLNICDGTSNSDCALTGACATSGASSYDLGKASYDVKAGQGEFYLEYLDGTACPGGKPRSSRVILRCDANEEGGRITDVVEDQPCHYLIYFATSLACTEDCQYINGYHMYDLSPLRAPFNRPYTYTQGGYQYDFNVCGGVTGTKCGDDNVGVCASNSFNQAWVLGGVSTALDKVGDKTYQLDYNGGTACSGVGPRQTELVFSCNPAQDPLKVIRVEEPSACRYRIIIETKYACQEHATALSANARYTFNGVYMVTLGEWNVFGASFFTPILMDVTKIRESQPDEWLNIELYGDDLELLFMSFLGDFEMSYVYDEDEGEGLFISIPALALDGDRYLDIAISSRSTTQIYSQLYLDRVLELTDSVFLPYLADEVLYSIPLTAPTGRVYYYCIAESGDPHTYLTDYNSNVLSEGVTPDNVESGMASLPEEDLYDAIIFLDIDAADRDPLINMTCSFHPMVYVYEDVIANPAWELTDVIYQFSVNGNVDELHLISSNENAVIEFFFAISARDAMEKEPTASAVGSLMINPKSMNRTDLALAIVRGPVADLKVDAIVYLEREEPESNSLRISDDLRVLDLEYTYVYELSPDFTKDSTVRINIISAYPEMLDIELANGEKLLCFDISSVQDRPADIPACSFELHASEINGTEIRFVLGLANVYQSLRLDLLVHVYEIIHITEVETRVEGYGAGDYLLYHYQVPMDFKDYAVHFATNYSSDNFQMMVFNRRSEEVFAASSETPAFGMAVLPGDLLELEVRPDDGSYGIQIRNMSIPAVYITAEDQSMSTFDRGVVAFNLTVTEPAFFLTNEEAYVETIVMGTFDDNPLWITVLGAIMEDPEAALTYEPFGNVISVRVEGVFNVSNREPYLCVHFSPVETLVVPSTPATSQPLCFTCGRNSCGPHCGDCQSGQECIDFICVGEATNATSQTEPAEVPLPVPVPNPVPVPVPVSVMTPVPMVTVVTTPVPVPVPVPNPIPNPIPVPVPVEVPVPMITVAPTPVPLPVPNPVPVPNPIPIPMPVPVPNPVPVPTPARVPSPLPTPEPDSESSSDVLSVSTLLVLLLVALA